MTDRAVPSRFRLVENARLDARNTFGVAATAGLLIDVADAAALPELFGPSMLGQQPVLVLGGGSNLLFAGDPEASVLALTSQSIHIVADDGEHVVVRVDAGVQWHALVLWTLGHGLAGLENLALIPGTVGAAPIQNIGAYGVEARDSVRVVEAFARDSSQLRRMETAECGFAYRDSVFKQQPDRFVVTAVEFNLARTPRLQLGYAGIVEELTAMGVDTPTPSRVAEAVCRIRSRKLPDPAVVGNAGSFFKNPILPLAIAQTLKTANPDLPMFPGADGATCKLSAAWLIDACGWKGHRDGDAGVSASHALVLVNHGHATGAQLLALARRIAASVVERFDIALDPEPRIIGARW